MQAGIQSVIDGVRAGTTHEIDLRQYGPKVDVAELVAAIRAAETQGLFVLYLSYAEIPVRVPGVRAICTILDRLLKLSLRHSGLDDAAAGVLADGMKRNTSIIAVDLSHNRAAEYSITQIGAASVAEMLKVNATLRKLVLDFCYVRDAGAFAVADALRVNTTLEFLSLNGGSIGDGGILAIMESLHVNSALTELRIENNDVAATATGASVLRMIESNSGVQMLTTDYCIPDDEILAAVRANPRSVLRMYMSRIASDTLWDELERLYTQRKFLALDSAAVRSDTPAGHFANNDGDRAIANRIMQFLMGTDDTPRRREDGIGLMLRQGRFFVPGM
jgi:hypothetical protein